MDIPDDIRAAAISVVMRGFNTRALHEAIERALMAEREQCAKIAETFWNHGGPSFRLATKIAAAIRTEAPQEQPKADDDAAIGNRRA